MYNISTHVIHMYVYLYVYSPNHSSLFSASSPLSLSLSLSPRSASLRSVFHSLRSGHCPYFYLCANQFTALFLSAGVGGCPRVAALLTPTTSGLRQALGKEGKWIV